MVSELTYLSCETGFNIKGLQVYMLWQEVANVVPRVRGEQSNLGPYAQ